MTPDCIERVKPRTHPSKPWWQAGLALILATTALGTLFVSLLSSGDGSSSVPAAPVTGGNFTASTVDGTQFPVPGSKPSVLLFFNIECGACGPATKVLAQVQQNSPANADYVAVDIAPQETAEEIKAFLHENDASTLAFTSDLNARLITAYQINQVSTVVVLDAAGREVFRAVEPGAEQLRTALAAAGAL